MCSRASEVSSLILRLVGCASMNRVLRSTTVTSAPRCPLPMTVSASQSPRRERSSTNAGPSEMSVRQGIRPRKSRFPYRLRHLLGECRKRRCSEPPFALSSHT